MLPWSLRKGCLELATGITFRGRGVRLERWEGGWRGGKVAGESAWEIFFAKTCPYWFF